MALTPFATEAPSTAKAKGHHHATTVSLSQVHPSPGHLQRFSRITVPTKHHAGQFVPKEFAPELAIYFGVEWSSRLVAVKGDYQGDDYLPQPSWVRQ